MGSWLNVAEQMTRQEISKARCRLMKARSNGAPAWTKMPYGVNVL
ncbi:hypothetical protein TIFTF001_002521 [Ficus carica]|uniref:Uncharacterized protein n=1 Tax=Ficus carica TaxID=3494 RepID=A0AA87ZDJ6_FICCA|nr:hypothetical protein TIFTF001_002521 [Ficus carica]